MRLELAKKPFIRQIIAHRPAKRSQFCSRQIQTREPTHLFPAASKCRLLTMDDLIAGYDPWARLRPGTTAAVIDLPRALFSSERMSRRSGVLLALSLAQRRAGQPPRGFLNAP